MFPLLTFVSGLVAGIAGVRLLKTVKAPEGLRSTTTARLGTIGDKARQGFDKAETGLRQATLSGLEALEKSSASLRDKLTPVAPEEPPPEEPPVVEETPVTVEPPPKPKAKRRSPRKKTPPPSAPETGAKS